MSLVTQQYTNPIDEPTQAEHAQLIAQAQVVPQGIWTEEPLSATLSLRIDGTSNTWVFVSDVRNGLSWTVVGDTLWLTFFFSITTTLPTATGVIRVMLPANYQLVSRGDRFRKTTFVLCYVSDGAGVLADGLASTLPDSSTGAINDPNARSITISRTGGGNFTAGSTVIAGQIALEVKQIGTL